MIRFINLIFLFPLVAAISFDNLYPFNVDGDTIITNVDDGSFGIAIPSNFVFFGTSYSSLFLNSNGMLSLGQENDNQALQFPNTEGIPVIAPYWCDIDTRGIVSDGNLIFTHVFTGSTNNVLQRATLDLQTYFEVIFNPTYVAVATWYKVGEYNEQTSLLDTFQAVLISDSETSYVIFLYADLEWAAETEAGFDAGDGINYLSLSGSFTSSILNLQSTSNTGVNGIWAFLVSDASGIVVSVEDCDGIFGGTLTYDACGVCGGDNGCLDCSGVPYGTLTYDACGVCGGDNSTCPLCTDYLNIESNFWDYILLQVDLDDIISGLTSTNTLLGFIDKYFPPLDSIVGDNYIGDLVKIVMDFLFV